MEVRRPAPREGSEPAADAGGGAARFGTSLRVRSSSRHRRLLLLLASPVFVCSLYLDPHRRGVPSDRRS